MVPKPPTVSWQEIKLEIPLDVYAYLLQRLHRPFASREGIAMVITRKSVDLRPLINKIDRHLRRRCKETVSCEERSRRGGVTYCFFSSQPSRPTLNCPMISYRSEMVESPITLLGFENILLHLIVPSHSYFLTILILSAETRGDLMK